MTDHANIYMALSAAQAEMGKVVKGANNPHFKSKYADLADVMQVALPALNAHGIAAWHSIVATDSGNVMRTNLSHGKSDTHIACDVPLLVQKNDMQGMKSATTYAKRIGIESLTGIAPEDDDGNDAVATPTPEASKADRTTTALAMMKDVIASGSEDDSRKMLAKIKLRESEKGLTKGTGSKAQAMFDEAFNQGA